MGKLSQIENTLALVLTTGVAVTSSFLQETLKGSQGEMVNTVIGGISVGLASSIIGGANYKKFRKFYTSIHPDELNHDLRRTLKYSLVEGFGFVQIKYSETLTNEADRKSFHVFMKGIIEDIDRLFVIEEDNVTSERQFKQLLLDDPVKGIEELILFLGIEFSKLNITSSTIPFETFLRAQLAGHIQLSFGQQLKESANSGVWIAFQKLMLEDIRENVLLILSGIKELKGEIQESRLEKQITGAIATGSITSNDKRKLQKFYQETTYLNKKISEKFDVLLQRRLSKLEATLRDILRHTTETLEISRKQIGISRRTYRLQLILVLLVVVVGLAYLSRWLFSSTLASNQEPAKLKDHQSDSAINIVEISPDKSSDSTNSMSNGKISSMKKPTMDSSYKKGEVRIQAQEPEKELVVYPEFDTEYVTEVSNWADENDFISAIIHLTNKGTNGKILYVTDTSSKKIVKSQLYSRKLYTEVSVFDAGQEVDLFVYHDAELNIRRLHFNIYYYDLFGNLFMQRVTAKKSLSSTVHLFSEPVHVKGNKKPISN